MDRGDDDSQNQGSSHCCLVSIARLQVTSTPNTSDLMGSTSQNGKYASHHFFAGIVNPFPPSVPIWHRLVKLSILIYEGIIKKISMSFATMNESVDEKILS